MYHYFMGSREKCLDHYHQRSNVETAYSMIKGKFGDSLRSKSDVEQINEARCKALCHNLCVFVQAMQEFKIRTLRTPRYCPKHPRGTSCGSAKVRSLPHIERLPQNPEQYDEDSTPSLF